MDVFATKDGSIYKVSLKNFIAATGKKSPYYKRVKQSGKYVKKAYGMCPGCSNPVHFVNLFNSSKKKKAHARHQRSSIRGLAKYNASAYKSCPYVLEVSHEKKEKSTSDEAASFSEIIQITFGFTKKSADLIAKIYLKLGTGVSDMVNQSFFALMASAVYYSTSFFDLFGDNPEDNLKQFLQGVAWSGVGAIPNDEIAKAYIVSLGFEKYDVDDLFIEIVNQHGSLETAGGRYYKKPDFAHLCATMATAFSLHFEKVIGALAAGSQNGVFAADMNAGYIGDVCGTAGIAPSINDGDYKSDLDAVNLAARLRADDTGNLLSGMTDYYENINKGKINRAKEFKNNIGLDVLSAQRDEWYRLLKKRYSESNEPEEQADPDIQIKVFDRFIACIEREAKEWPDEQ